jgi:undecaprenyl diphosphate synthase
MTDGAVASLTACNDVGLDPRLLPRHVAIIMDGNGRWAKRAGWQRLRGHERGAETVRTVTTVAAKFGLQRLTLYAFSSENWRRPKREVDGLMRLLVSFLKSELPVLQDNNVRLSTIGRIQTLPAKVQDQLDATQAATSTNTGLELCLALAYGGRQELVDAMRTIVSKLLGAGVPSADLAEHIDETAVQQALYAPSATDVDLLIRTAGEQRISNFLPWQTVYAEYYSAAAYWPDFGEQDFMQALRDYQQRERRFGRTGEQVLEDQPGS